MVRALEQVRRMRGGAQSHLMRCSDGGYYVVKFQNNPQGLRILVNELLGTRLAARLGLRVPEVNVVSVDQELIARTDDLVMQLGRGRNPCVAGKQFGSRYPGKPAEVAVYDFLPDEQLQGLSNLADFLGMLVFDKWTCNTNGRQAIFFRERGAPEYSAQMIDNGFCFNAGDWNFPDAPLRGLYARHRVYESVNSLDSFSAWLGRVQSITEAEIEKIYSEIPPEWYSFNVESIEKMLQHLLRRKKLVADLIVSAWKSSAQPFPNWR
jgi:hypothetical protein